MTPDDRYQIDRILDSLVRTPARTEVLRFVASLDKARVDRYAPELRGIGYGWGVETVQEGDTLKASYELKIDYFGRVVDALEAFSKILADPDVVLKLEVDELEHGKSVLFDLVQRIIQVQQVIERRAWDALIKTEAPIDVQVAVQPSFWRQLRDWLSFR